jgi:hypothetical protein
VAVVEMLMEPYFMQVCEHRSAHNLVQL